MYAHTYVCMYTRIMFVCKACVCMHVCIFAWSHEWHTPNVRCDRCSDGRVLCTCLVVNVFRWRCMGLQGLGNRLRVVICERRISAVRPCLFLPLPRRAGCARKARSAKRHFRRVRRLRLPAHGKAVQHAPRTDFLPLPLPSQTESLLKHTSEGPKFYVRVLWSMCSGGGVWEIV